MSTQPSGQEPQQPKQSSPPSAERPAGPPSGPLSGGRQGPPPPPPPAPPGGTPPGPAAGGPWWRTVPRLATALVAVAAAVALAVVLTRPSGSPSAGGEVFLQPAAVSGPDPFTESTATNEATRPPETAPPPSPQSPLPTTGAIATRSVSGASPGLYGGTRSTASCDVEQQIRELSAQPAKNSAFASVPGIEPAAVPGYLRSLTPVQLGLDTRVTNHGYRDGKATAYQAVLQAGTAVLVDARGVPRVRCACGNPLGSPVALNANPKRFGQTWSTYQPTKVVAIAPSVTVVNTFVIYDRHERRWFERDRGDHHGKHDKPVPPPVFPTQPVTPTYPTPPATPTHPTTSVTPTLPLPPVPPTKSVSPSHPLPPPVPSKTEPKRPAKPEPESPTTSATEPKSLTRTETPTPPGAASVTPSTSVTLSVSESASVPANTPPTAPSSVAPPPSPDQS